MGGAGARLWQSNALCLVEGPPSTSANGLCADSEIARGFASAVSGRCLLLQELGDSASLTTDSRCRPWPTPWGRSAWRSILSVALWKAMSWRPNDFMGMIRRCRSYPRARPTRGRYATREDEVDNLLRAEVFVDVYSVVRHSIRASVESYSIKKLEPLYGFLRDVPLIDAGVALTRVQMCFELADAAGIAEHDKGAIIG